MTFIIPTWAPIPGVPRFCKNASVVFFQSSSTFGGAAPPESYWRLRDRPSGLRDLDRDFLRLLEEDGTGNGASSPGGKMSEVPGGGGKSASPAVKHR